MSDIKKEEYEPIHLAALTNRELIAKIRTLLTTIESLQGELKAADDHEETLKHAFHVRQNINEKELCDKNKIIESQKEEIENLREMKIRRIEVENGAINFSIQGEAGMSFAAILLKFYEDNGGKNFFTFDVEKDGMRLSTTIENKHGELTVSEKLNQQSREIESLKAITDGLADERHDLINEVDALKDKIFDQKAITELAVNKFKEINIAYMLWIDSELDCDIAASRMDTIAETTLSEIERLQNE